MSDRLPCPFCDSNNIEQINDDGVFWKKCVTCGAEGPTVRKRDGAEDEPYINWDTRGGLEGCQGRILVWYGKHGPWFCRAQTERELEMAYLACFRAQDRYYTTGYFDDDAEDALMDGNAECVDDLKAAREGDAQAARAFLEWRSDEGYDYSSVVLESLADPFDEMLRY